MRRLIVNVAWCVEKGMEPRSHKWIEVMMWVVERYDYGKPGGETRLVIR